MPTFFGRKYMRNRVPIAETIIGVVVLLVLAGIVATTIIVSTRAENVPPRIERVDEKVSPFPAIELADWKEPAEFRQYTPLDLWEKINGRADFYLQYGMRRMIFGTYRRVADSTRSVDVFWYELGSSDGAFGVYQAESGGRVTRLDVGDEGYGAGGSVIFRKGCHYVRVEPNGEGEEFESAGLAIAQAVAERIEGTGAELWADALLPREGRSEAGLAFHGANAFSLDFLSAVFSADYSADGKTFTTFIHRASDENAAAKLLDAYEAFFKDYGLVIERGRIDGIEFIVGESAGVVDAAFTVGVYLGGVNNTDDAVLAKERALAFAGGINARTDEGAR